ncbi:MAG: ABC-F family ATP-binding cassette domain-containing protein, partial [Candidatus Moranbacteria bacterium]|nr:ABC-F family ATP-binding cassette domain-containing protein [Candidatus Moranbacteria bacterium]
LTVLGLERKIGSLSGGQRAKVILAKLLLENPDVLLLDEPTNFLDKEHVSWLSLYLRSFPGAILLISHDVSFLNEVVDHVAALEGGEIHKYRGNYSVYLEQKALSQQTQSGLRDKQQKLIAKTKDYIARNGARASTAKQAQSRQKMLNKLEIIEPPENAKPPKFSFALAKGAHGNSLNINGLVVGYEKPLLPALDFSIKDGEKVAITGFNGIGKSTLLKTIIGEITALAGSGRFACNIVLNYFEQDLKWQEPRLTPLEIMMASFPEIMPGDLRGKLAMCTIKSEHVRQPIMSLSGGEQAKVKLARMMLKPSNFLILDEPTNHLDVLAKSALKKAIADFAGAVILVSHEADFYEGLV